MRSTLAVLAVLVACGSPPPTPTTATTSTVSPECPAQIEGVRTAAREARAQLVAKDPEIAAFWTWWRAHREELAGPVNEALVEQMTAHVLAMDPALTWEVTPAPKGPRSLVVGASGGPRAHQVATRWLEAAPKDPTWTFATLHQPVEAEMLRGGSLQLGDTTVPFAELKVVTAEQTRGGLSVTLWHPALADLDREAALQIAFITLDNTLGEDGVTRWLGDIEVATKAPTEEMIDLIGLRERVTAIAKRHAPGDLQLLTLTRAGEPPLIATLAVGIVRIDRPLHDTFVELSHAYVPEEIEASQGIEASVLERLGDRGTHHSSLTGVDRRYTWIYIDGTSDALDTICAWRAEQTRPIEIDAALDPAWVQATQRISRPARPR